MGRELDKRLQEYRDRRANPYPRQRGSRYNLPDGMSARVGETVSPSVTIIGHGGGKLTASTSQTPTALIQHQQLYPLASEINNNLYIPPGGELYVTAVWMVDNNVSMDNNYILYDGSSVHYAFLKARSTYSRDGIASTGYALSKSGQYLLMTGYSNMVNTNANAIHIWKYNDSNISVAKNICNNFISGSYLGDGSFSTSSPTQDGTRRITFISDLKYIIQNTAFRNAFMFIKGTDRPLVFNDGDIIFWDSSTASIPTDANFVTTSFSIANPPETPDSLVITVSQGCVPYVNDAGRNYDYLLFNVSGNGCFTSSGSYEPSSDISGQVFEENNNLSTDFVIIHNATNTGSGAFSDSIQTPAVFWTSAHPEGESSLLNNSSNITDGVLGVGIEGFDMFDTNVLTNGSANGFNGLTVKLGSNKAVVNSNTLYNYIMGPDTKHRGYNYEVGKYTGNGSSQTIPLPFNANNWMQNLEMSWILVKGNNNGYGRWKWACHTDGRSISTEGGVADITNGIISMDLSSFTVGDSIDVNEDGVEYYFAAMTTDIIPVPSDETLAITNPGYNYQDGKLYWWINTAIDQKNFIDADTLPDFYGKLLCYDPDHNQVAVAASEKYTPPDLSTLFFRFQAGTSSFLFDNSKCVFHPTTNRLFWCNFNNNGIYTWDATNGAQRSFLEKNYDGVVNGHFFSRLDTHTGLRVNYYSTQFASSELIVFSGAIYSIRMTNNGTSTNLTQEAVIIKNVTGNPFDWEIDQVIDVTNDWPSHAEDHNLHYVGNLGATFGTFWPEGASEPTEMYLILNARKSHSLSFGGTDYVYPGFLDSDGLQSIWGNESAADYVIYRKKSADSAWEFEEILAVSGNSSTDPNVYPNLDDVVQIDYIGTGSSNKIGIDCEPKIIFWFSGDEDSSHPAYFRTPNMPDGHGSTFIGSGDVSGLFDSIVLNGGNSTITLSGSDQLNNSGSQYEFYVFPEKIRGVRRMDWGTYIGDGTATRDIQTEFPPEMVWVKSIGNEVGCYRTPNMDSGKCFSFTEGPFLEDRITSNSISSTYRSGFQIGGNDDVNKVGQTYYWVAFEKQLIVNVDWIGNGQNRQFLTNKVATTNLVFLKPNADASIDNGPSIFLDSSTAILFDGNKSTYDPVIPSYADQNFFLSANSNTNLVDRRYFFSGFCLNTIWGNDIVLTSSLFSMRGRMCLWTQGDSRDVFTGTNDNFYPGLRLYSRTPDRLADDGITIIKGKWGLTDGAFSQPNNTISANPTNTFTDSFGITPQTGDLSGSMYSGVVGFNRDSNKQ